jgi:hypothetical protein
MMNVHGRVDNANARLVLRGSNRRDILGSGLSIPAYDQASFGHRLD